MIISLAGDYNADGTVDAADFTIWQDTLGTTVVKGSFADGDGSGAIDMEDYTIWKNNFGHSGLVSTVPEPTAIVIVIVVLGFGLILRCH